MSIQGYGTYQDAQAKELDQVKLILMMYAGAIRFLNKALAVAAKDKVEMGHYLSKTKNVIFELMSSLDVKKGGEMGGILLRMYKTLLVKLNVAHMKDDVDKIIEVRNSLSELEHVWKQVFARHEFKEPKQSNQYAS